LIDWCLTPTLAVFQLYRGVVGNISTVAKETMHVCMCSEQLGSLPFFVGSVFLILLDYCIVCVVCLSLSCVLNVSSVSGLSILDCPFGFL